MKLMTCEWDGKDGQVMQRAMQEDKSSKEDVGSRKGDAPVCMRQTILHP